MQEADGFGLKHHSGNCDIELEEDRRVTASEPGGIAETAARQAFELMDTEGIASKVIRNDGAGGESTSASAMDIVGLLEFGLSAREAGETFGVVDEVANQAGEVLDTAPANIEKFEMLPGTDQHEKSERCSQADDFAGIYNQQYMPEESFVFVGESHVEPPLTRSTNSFDVCTSLGDTSPISLPQLLEAIKVSSEDEYRLLLMSRESRRNFISSQHDFPILIERLSEKLFVSTCVKDILLMQLSEQSNLQTQYDLQFQKMDDEISVLHASLNESLQKCDRLAEELAERNSKLEFLVSGKEELQVQLHAAEVEMKMFLPEQLSYRTV